MNTESKLATINSALSDMLVNPRIRAYLMTHEPGERLRIELALSVSTGIPVDDLSKSFDRKAASLRGVLNGR